MSRRFRVVRTEVAIADVEGIVDYVAVHDSLAAAEKLHDKLETSIDSLITSPPMGFLWAPGLATYQEVARDDGSRRSEDEFDDDDDY